MDQRLSEPDQAADLASDELICPKCGATQGRARDGKLRHCAADGRVLVHKRALAAAPADAFLGLCVGGRFSVLEVLGAGSMATVYRARHEPIGRDVALKILRSDRLIDAHAKGRFQREAQAMSLLTSPHTATVFDFGEIHADDDPTGIVDGSLFLAMELLEGESLGKRLKRTGKLPVADALRVARHALHSLAEAHAKGIIHRDLKPDNLILIPDPTGAGELAKVLDFGIAKLIGAATGVDALETQAGTVFGTPRYMSPEQAQGKPLDARSDLYALGVILYHMLAGRPPYTDRDAVVVMAHHIKTPPPRLSDVAPDTKLPAALEALVMRSLAKDPTQRPQSAAVFLRALESFGPPTDAAADTVAATGDQSAVMGRPASRRPSRARPLLVGAGLVAVGVLSAGARAWVDRRETLPAPARPGLYAGVRDQGRLAPPASAGAGAAPEVPLPAASEAPRLDAGAAPPTEGTTDGATDGADAGRPTLAPDGRRLPQVSSSPKGGKGGSYERFDKL